MPPPDSCLLNSLGRSLPVLSGGSFGPNLVPTVCRSRHLSTKTPIVGGQPPQTRFPGFRSRNWISSVHVLRHHGDPTLPSRAMMRDIHIASGGLHPSFGRGVHTSPALKALRTHQEGEHFESAGSHNAHGQRKGLFRTDFTPRPSRTSFLISFAGVAGLLTIPLYIYYWNGDSEVKFVSAAATRIFRVAYQVVAIILDYKVTLRNAPLSLVEFKAEAAKKGVELSTADVVEHERKLAEYENLQKTVHKRSAERLLDVCKRNGGVFIKLGQHIAAMSYVLPTEYTETMRPLQDRCPVTPIEDIEELFRTDLGVEMKDIIVGFEEKPLGVASLAQVHRGWMKVQSHINTEVDGRPSVSLSKGTYSYTEDMPEEMAPPAPRFKKPSTSAENQGTDSELVEVAIKIQHPYLDLYTAIDMETVALAVKLVKRAFPRFEFGWLAEEVQINLPREMDFTVEASNSKKISDLFKQIGNKNIHVPEVFWAERRLMCMEFVHGYRLDDLGYLAEHKIDPKEVSAQISEAYNQMIFKFGFVHADPHPGNILVQPRNSESSIFAGSTPNFKILLLDHGLYRSLSQSFRFDYALLWSALISGDEGMIQDQAKTLFDQARRAEYARKRSRNEVLPDYDSWVEKEYGERADGSRSTSQGDPQDPRTASSHIVFASILTGRPWHVLVDSENPDAKKKSRKSKMDLGGMARVITSDERKRVKEYAGTASFFLQVADTLARVPRELILLLKTNDLLRSLDQLLDIHGSPTGSTTSAHMLRTVARTGEYCATTVYEGRLRQISKQQLHGQTLTWLNYWWFFLQRNDIRRAYIDFWDVSVRLWGLRMWLRVNETWEDLVGWMLLGNVGNVGAAAMAISRDRG
ncbi:ABC1-domain-containing protein [Gonapodya prolifera JEL478]|uniref:ABC1-domain-containing protein n=1 Tax=Gonapodya prolifera (strain JEL478) TaxID=1344416 RepID=A0A139A763_GONPJ|nr:ABC1-domain-containing protein [Gonapodya prolifera JEL478]|eukprot:KXS12183.1 ABC1-domain-containing protein [Gonapodya prolifera JEL478]